MSETVSDKLSLVQEKAPAKLRRKRLNILGVRVDESHLQESVLRCSIFLKQPPAKDGGRLHHVLTVNPEFVIEARRNTEFMALINKADLATPDGIGIIIASAILGKKLGGRTTGVALSGEIARVAAERGYRMFLLGAAPGVAAEAGRIWTEQYPGLQIAGSYPGSPDPEEVDEITARVTAAEADILFVAFGAPRQDFWIEQNRDKLPTVRLAMGVGGVFDYTSGRVPLAPPFLRKIGMEWAYRLYKQPWRWRRMLALPQFVLLALGQRLGFIRNG